MIDELIKTLRRDKFKTFRIAIKLARTKNNNLNNLSKRYDNN